MKSFAVPWSYAMKAKPSHAVLGLFRDLGLHIDASSDPEVERALGAGFAPARIQLTSQVPSSRLEEFVALGVLYNACSLHQLDRYGRAFPERAAIIRVNPGLGSGSTKRTNTGGPASSFGIWHAYLDEAKTLAARHRLVIRGLHTHIGSGSDPAVRTRVAGLVLEIAARLPDVTTVSLGGGFKVARVAGEQTTNLVAVGSIAREAFIDFHRRTGRKLRLEIEPGAYLVANAGAGGAARAGREPPAGAAAAEPRADARQRGGVSSGAVPGRSVARDGGAGRRGRRLRFDSAPPSRVAPSAAARGAS